MKSVDIRLAVALMTVIASTSHGLADESNLQTKLALRPDLLTAMIGDVTIRIDGPKLWTLSGIDYRKSVIAVPDSAYGTVLNLRGIGLLGSAHFLDVPGRPGEIEKENVTRTQFFLDDKSIDDLQPMMTISGENFRMERESTIRAVRLNSSVSLSNNVLLESVRIRTESEVDLVLAFPLMYAWTPDATEYLFGDDQGIQKRGRFLERDAKPAEGLEKTANWMAVYDRAAGIGAVCRLKKRPANQEVWFQYTDAPGVYRKLRLMCFSDKPIPAQFDGTIQTAVTFFVAEEHQWETVALSQLDRLGSDAGESSQ